MFKPILKCLLIMSTVVSVSACVAEKKLTLTSSDAGRMQFPAPKSFWNGKATDLIGTLDFPTGVTGKVPAMIILHGSAGPGYRDSSWAKFFNDNGIASFRVDYYSTRGISRGGANGPRSPYDLTAAINFLSTHPNIDATRIGAMGFSRGGTIVAGALQFHESEFTSQKPRLNVIMYGFCGIDVSSSTTDSPVLLIVGDRDKLALASQCEDLANRAKKKGKDFRSYVMPGGTHAFDDNKGGTFSFGGSSYTVSPSSSLTEQARQIVLTAAKEAFK